MSFFDAIQLEECNAEAICKAIKASLIKNGLNIKNLVGIGTDNASVMTGQNSGVYARLKNEIPNLVLIKCVCHSIQLAVSHSAAEALPRNLEFRIKETYNWFAHSTIRENKYNNIYSTINEDKLPLKMIMCSTTRWLSIAKAISRIYDQWHELKLHFEIFRTNERCYNAELLYTMFCDDQNFVYLSFLKPILDEVTRTNKLFESVKCDPVKLMIDLNQLINSLCSKVVIPGTKIDQKINVREH